jgi:TonB family protein
MTELKQRPEVEQKARRRMLITLVLLLVTLGIVVIKDRAIWFTDDSADTYEASQESVPAAAAPAPSTNVVAATGAGSSTAAPAHSVRSSVPAAKTTKSEGSANKKSEVAANLKNEVAAKNPSEPAVPSAPVVSGTRTELPPMDVEVIAGDAHRTIHPGGNSVKVELPRNSGAKVTSSFKWSPVTNAAELDRLSPNTLESMPKPVESSYPALARQMNVQGSVLIQAFVGADGGIRDLRVLSGPAILVSAALEAARQWRFKPYIQNGQPVETQAKITVNFNIKVL